MVTHKEYGLVLGVSFSPTPRGGVPVLPNFGGSFLFMRTPFVAEQSNQGRSQGGQSHPQSPLRKNYKAKTTYYAPPLGGGKR